MTRIQDPGTSVRGWPRPRRQYEPDVEQHPERVPAILPVPWVVGDDWLDFQPDAPTAEAERLCQVCGERLGRVMVLCRGHRPRVTSGPGCHPRCAALAVRFCPHLVEMDASADVAYRYEGFRWLGYSGRGTSRSSATRCRSATEQPRSRVMTCASWRRPIRLEGGAHDSHHAPRPGPSRCPGADRRPRRGEGRDAVRTGAHVTSRIEETAPPPSGC